eukprot:UN03703
MIVNDTFVYVGTSYFFGTKMMSSLKVIILLHFFCYHYYYNYYQYGMEYYTANWHR